jgi:hypothetical protein
MNHFFNDYHEKVHFHFSLTFFATITSFSRSCLPEKIRFPVTGKRGGDSSRRAQTDYLALPPQNTRHHNIQDIFTFT